MTAYCVNLISWLTSARSSGDSACISANDCGMRLVISDMEFFIPTIGSSSQVKSPGGVDIYSMAFRIASTHAT
ncbi:hypothetical protein BD626DRAFT_517585 [Schizophyllum amplum]|uniref:Uncharacterized protein n=1 Tax=Schizophyllum amplum TaxID=97359 RepID=A0A550BWA8_9AGAR|nr:hypothetical protein BD626DRAFT_525827 [Auriculariopsis ampla]TRM56834.1 hypothetical protein BD626DRAFT_517585 [Auriculariopsis ampla]